MKLSAYLRSGSLTAVWVPDQEQEAMRDLTRARDDMKSQERKARQQLNGFVLRHGHSYPSHKTRWTKNHYHWLESIKFEQAWLQIVLQEYIDAVKAATRRVVDITEQMMQALPHWSMAPIVDSLVAFLGLVPGEHSSGESRRQRAITRTGNGHARRMLVESAWWRTLVRAKPARPMG